MSVTTIPTMAWPEPFPLDAPITPPPFPTDSLPLWLRNFVRAQAEAAQVPEDLTGMLALATVSGALQGRVEAKFNRTNWSEPITFYTAIALPPGERKSSVFRRMIRPLTEWEAERQRIEAPIVSESQQDRAEIEKAIERADNAIQKLRGEALKLDMDDNATPDQKLKVQGDLATMREAAINARVELMQHDTLYPFRVTFNDLTPEACAQALSQQKHEALAILSDEGGVFEVLTGSRYADRLNLDVFLKGHSGDLIQIDRVGRPSERIERPMLTLGLAVQPSVLRDIGKSKQMHGRGLLGRFAYSIPTTRIGTRVIDSPEVPAAVAEAYATNIAAIAEAAHSSQTLYYLFPTDEADVAFMQYQQGVEPRLGEDFDGENPLNNIPDWGNKLSGLVGRIAAIIAAARAGGLPESIELEDIRAAMTFGPYLEAHAQLAFALMGLTPNINFEQKLLRRLKGQGITKFKTRDLQRLMSSARHYTAPELDEILEGLENMGWLRRVTESVKPPRHHWTVNPALHSEE